MKLVQNIKRKAGGRKLKKEKEPQRQRVGSNFSVAQRVGLVYADSDEAFFNKVKSFAKFLKDKYDIKSVRALGFVDAPNKHLPPWQAQKLELEYFTREDLNWHMRPIQNVKTFVQDDFDILIDLTSGNIVPVSFVVHESLSKMKVCRKGSLVEKYCDFIINIGEEIGFDKYVEQLNVYLSNPKIK